MLFSTMLLPMLAMSALAQDVSRETNQPAPPVPVTSVELLITEPTFDAGPIVVPTPIPASTSREPHNPHRYGPKPGLKEMK